MRKYSTLRGGEFLAGIKGWDRLPAGGMAESLREVGDTVLFEIMYFIMSTCGEVCDFGNTMRETGEKGFCLDSFLFLVYAKRVVLFHDRSG